MAPNSCTVSRRSGLFGLGAAFFLSCFMLWGPGGGLAVGKAAPVKKQGQAGKIKEELFREKVRFHEFGAKEKSLLNQLSRLEQSIKEQREFLGQLKEKIEKVRKEIEVQDAELEKLRRSRREAESRLAGRLVAFYKHARRGYIHLLATSSGLHQLRKRVKYLQVLLAEDRALLARLEKIHLRHRMEIANKKERLRTIDRLRKEESERLASLKSTLDQKVLLLMKVHKEKEFYETAVKELEQAAKGLGRTIRDLDERANRPHEQTMLPPDFAAAMGKLPLPFHGKIVKGFKLLKATHAAAPRGIYIEGPPGGEVRAVYPGRIDYSGWLKGYGQIVVINHGSRYFTVYAHLSRRDREKGDTVRGGDVIGLLGDSQSFIGPRLYFEIRKGGENLDPMKWLKVH